VSPIKFLCDGIGPVPPNATVIFEVELLYITRGPRSLEAFKEIDADKDKALTKEEVIDISQCMLIAV